ncbi:MAG: ATP-dependent DNA helicase RecG [Microthrixaceae bacterium]|nr:ATP-dependent DNA helicase RecG [Microthrixaceae bacterium]
MPEASVPDATSPDATSKDATSKDATSKDESPITLAELSTMGVELLVRVGPRKLDGLRSMGITSLLDLLFHYPRRYVDRTREARVRDLDEGEEALVIGRVTRVESRRTRRGKAMVTVSINDGTGTLGCTFFNQPWRANQLDPDSVDGEVAVFGKVELYRGQRRMTNPVVDLVGDRTGRIVPIYPQSDKARLTSWELGEWVDQTLRRCSRRTLGDPLPAELRERLELVARAEAFHDIHNPAAMPDVVAARHRLAFDELLRIQLSLVRTKREMEASSTGIPHPVGGGAPPNGSLLVDQFLDELPYEPTGAQRRAISQIRDDLARNVPMHRLLQGDVGAGKTVVAVAALLCAVEGGHQGALMAPTEVLAEQHHVSLRQMLDGLDLSAEDNLFGTRALNVAALTNRTPAKRRREVLAGLAEGSVDIVVGTHSLIQEAVKFHSLGVAVVDEQHRFGVEQRAALRSANPDGTVPDVLVMTATPIPRTAAMTVYGDLDVTVLDELPPGRTPVATTLARSPEEVAGAWELVRSEVGEGRRAFVVCPLIEGSDRSEASAAEVVFSDLAATELAGLDVGLIHGRVRSDERAQVMTAFRNGALQVLVATTVIEVGVDVPEATVMVVLDADHFGIAQLHQLRGRVGRGDHPGHCVLVAGGELTDDGVERLEALVQSTDGFELAEVDLQLRGEGTVMGERQKGRSDLKLASLRKDRALVELARGVAFELVDGPGGLGAHPQLRDEVEVLLAEEDEEFLTKG